MSVARVPSGSCKSGRADSFLRGPPSTRVGLTTRWRNPGVRFPSVFPPSAPDLSVQLYRSSSSQYNQSFRPRLRRSLFRWQHLSILAALAAHCYVYRRDTRLWPVSCKSPLVAGGVNTDTMTRIEDAIVVGACVELAPAQTRGVHPSLNKGSRTLASLRPQTQPGVAREEAARIDTLCPPGLVAPRRTRPRPRRGLSREAQPIQIPPRALPREARSIQNLLTRGEMPAWRTVHEISSRGHSNDLPPVPPVPSRVFAVSHVSPLATPTATSLWVSSLHSSNGCLMHELPGLAG